MPPRIRTSDALLTLALMGWAAIEALAAQGPGSLGQRLVFAVAVTAPLLLRRRAPVAVVLVLIGVLAARILLLPGLEESTFPFPSLLVATFSVALYERRRWAGVLAGIAIAAAMVSLPQVGYYDGPASLGELLLLAFFVSGAWIGGWLVRLRLRQLAVANVAAERAASHADQLAEEIARTALEAERAAEEAVATERARIAREIHDVVAHSLSIVVVQAGAAESLMDGDPDRAREHIAAARRTAREALTEMRHVLDVTRDDETQPDLAPQPTLERIGDLVDDSRAAGLAVTLSVEGRRGAVPAGLDLAAFRIVQEALTNARRHAGQTPTTVRLRYDDEGIDIEVSNAMTAEVGGRGGERGLIGMRERARLYGGSLDAGRHGGMFTVRARLPRSAT
ncbi:signal transduction histidine kinase [Asanoa ferruginea]|uniref:histidine kinase n=1 Tax=Asanoa ferruginea TaxID=53367 RepID=A0A3D9ZH63_9ACTN|nr:signal transduction histidine kinase [Asanoa ferruginea]